MTFRVGEATGSLGLHTTRLVRDRSVQTPAFSPSGGVANYTASHLQLKYRKIQLSFVIFAHQIRAVFSVFFVLANLFLFPSSGGKSVLCPQRSQNPPFFRFLLFLSSAPAASFHFLTLGQRPRFSHWLFLSHHDLTGYLAALISSFCVCDFISELRLGCCSCYWSASAQLPRRLVTQLNLGESKLLRQKSCSGNKALDLLTGCFRWALAWNLGRKMSVSFTDTRTNKFTGGNKRVRSVLIRPKYGLVQFSSIQFSWFIDSLIDWLIDSFIHFL